MPFGLANAGSVYSRILDVVMKEVDMAHFGHSCSLGTRGSWNQDTTLQNQAVPVQGGVPGAKDQQRRRFYDPRIHTEDQGLACAWEGSGYVLGIRGVLQNLHTPVFSTDEPVERD